MLVGIMSYIEFNEQFQHALDLMEKTKKNVFITGRAGTGKSTLLKYFRDHTKKKIVVLAPTGVAAVNIAGQTIHSFFGFKPDITVSKVKKKAWENGKETVYKKLEAIVIDEISMVRADLMDCVDKCMRLNGPTKDLPFGGVQMIMIGDLYQLPPVVTSDEKELFSRHYQTPYFFSAAVFSPQQALISDEHHFQMELVELETVYRQKDDAFIALLNAIRNNTADERVIAAINARHDKTRDWDAQDFTMYLTTTNAMAKDINTARLLQLKTKSYSFDGIIQGRFDENSLPTDTKLALKIGAQVMLLNNDANGRWINGTVGEVVAVESNKDGSETEAIMVKLQGGERVAVTPYRWDMYEFRYDRSSRQIESDSVGSFTQYPMKLAWAVTIHKSQGKTFDRVIVDIGRGTFSSGQLYVALSRCTTLEGLTLKQPIHKKHIWIDWSVVKFLTSFQYRASEAALSLEEKVRVIAQAIQDEKKLAITYLKTSDEKSRRVIIPHEVGDMEYLGKNYLGVEAYCCTRKENRVFRVDRILEMVVEK